MPRRMLLVLFALSLLLTVRSPAQACSLCASGAQRPPTFREEAAQAQARLILYGTLRNPRLTADGKGGVTELAITNVVRDDTALGGRKVIEIPKYLPVSDPKNPPQFLVFCDVFRDSLDPYRGVPLKNADALDYARKSIVRDPRDKVANLAFYFNYLENSDKEVAQDAFLEFAKATDREIGQAASKLSAEKLRRWLKDPQTPAERLSLYAFMLGACGGNTDADLLASLLKDSSERVVNAYDGLLGGFIHLRPREGWELALATLADGRRPLPIRLAVVRTLRFYHGWEPEKSRPMVVKALSTMIAQCELADVAVEDLRRFGIWDLNRQVFAVYGKKGYDAPLMQRAIVRYALCAKPDDDVTRFLAERRRTDADLVKEEEELLQAEKK